MQSHGVSIVLVVVFTATVILSYVADISSVNVTYDHRSLLFDGKRQFLLSGSIHYPRSTPQMWPSLLNYSKQGGLDVVQTYVFWDIHEPQNGTYNFAGRFDLVKFVKEAAAAGLYVNLRIGPYVCAEWNFGKDKSMCKLNVFDNIIKQNATDYVDFTALAVQVKITGGSDKA